MVYTITNPGADKRNNTMKPKIKIHYNSIQVFFNGDEVEFNGKDYVCIGMGVGVINIPPNDTRSWKRKYEPIELKLRYLNYDRIKDMHFGEMIDIIVLPTTWNETFREQVCEKYFETTKN